MQPVNDLQKPYHVYEFDQMKTCDEKSEKR